MKLIIAEKNSLAKNIATALNVPYSNGKLQNKDFIILPCAGHLLAQKDVAEYKEWKDVKGWKNYTLPLIPNPFELKISKDKTTLFNAIKDTLEKNKEIDEVIHWCDPDREGQLIADEILFKLKNNKKVSRCWHLDESELSLQKAFRERKDNKDYYNLYLEARTRAELDWLVGINSTIFASVKSGTLAKLGRVKIPILQYIYDREMEIKNFKPTPYFTVVNEKNIKLNYNKTFKDKQEAIKFMEELNKNKAKVIDMSSKKIKKQPKPMFSQTSLQNYMATKYSWKPDKTLDISQAIYDKKLITYARADSEYFSTEEKPDVKQVLLSINDARVSFDENNSCFNNKKINAHTALRPTTVKAFNLTEDEQKLYDTIKNRFLANFTTEERIVEETTLKIKVGEIDFKLSGDVLISEGWGVFEQENITNNLPKVNVGDEFEVDFKVKDKMTTPPPKISIKALNNWMENPLKKVEHSTESIEETETEDDKDIEITDEDFKNQLDGIKIGTTATRPAIIKDLEKTGYITVKGKNYSITENGIYLIELKNKLDVKVNKEQTIEMEKWLTKIGKGELSPEDVKKFINDRIKEMISSDVEIEKKQSENGNGSKVFKEIGVCPCCGKKVLVKNFKNGTVYQCESVYPDKKCDFTVNAEQKFPEHKITEKEMAKLLKGETILLKAKSKQGTDYEANYKIEKNGNWWNLKFDSFKK